CSCSVSWSDRRRLCILSHACFLLRADLVFFNQPVTSARSPLSLHAALPILRRSPARGRASAAAAFGSSSQAMSRSCARVPARASSGEHTSELQSLPNLVCRLLLEKKKTSTLPIATHSRRPTPSHSCLQQLLA